MRQRLNENPVVQVVLIGFLGLIVAALFVTRVMHSGSPEGAAPAPGASADAASAPVAPGAAVSPAVADAATNALGAAGASEAAAAAGVTLPDAAPRGDSPPAASGFEAGPGLPKPIARAHARGDTVALLVTKQKGVDDRSMRKAAHRLRGRRGVTLVTTGAYDIAKYSRIAQGVDLDRVPALVVIQAKRQGKGGMPIASVSYGYRGPDSVVQALKDTLYDGKVRGFQPK